MVSSNARQFAPWLAGEGVAVASIIEPAGPVRGAWEALAAYPVALPMLSVDLRLGVLDPGPCLALLAVPSTEPAATPCTCGKRARKRACWRPWVRMEAVDTAVLVTKEDASKDRIAGPVTTTVCLPVGMAVVPLVAASTDTGTANPLAYTDTNTDTDTTGAEVCTARGGGAEVSVHYVVELVGLDKMVLVTAEEEWAGLAASPIPSPVSTAAVGLHHAAVDPGPGPALLVVLSTEPTTTPCTWERRARKKAYSRP